MNYKNKSTLGVPFCFLNGYIQKKMQIKLKTYNQRKRNKLTKNNTKLKPNCENQN